ncbi:MAG: hypothetical protein M1281_19240 [Chloroflexi bacterium]|nr:hypothetical protein [Chloroflexota bacterium]
MGSNKSLAGIIILLLAAAQGCNQPAGGAGSLAQMLQNSPVAAIGQAGKPVATSSPSQAMHTPESPEVLPPQNDENSPITGLYLPSGIYPEGDAQRLTILAPLPCASLLSIFEGGEWQVSRQVNELSLSGPQMLALLERGDHQLFVHLSSLYRGSESASRTTPTATANPTPSATPTLAATAIPAGPMIGAPGYGEEYCVAVLQQVSRQPLHAQGVVTANGEADEFPSLCSIIEGKASLVLYFQGPGGLLAALRVKFPAESGEHALDLTDEPSLQLFPDSPGFFEMQSQMAEALATPESNVSTPGEAFVPGGDSAGTVTLTNLAPLEGKIVLDGWVSEGSGAPQSFEAGFSCTPPEGLPKDIVDLRPIARPEVSLALDMRYDLGPVEQNLFTEAGSVHLEGVLKATSPDTYSGQWEATGQGSFTGFGTDLKACTNHWKGNQLLQVEGRLLGSNKLSLTFSPAAQPEVQFENSCGMDTHEPGFLPVSNAQLRGTGSLELAWPLDAAGNAGQTIDGHIQGSEADFGTWTANFLP